MRIALFSDVHGNLSALDAVLSDIDRKGADLTIFAGDLCIVGPRPETCVRRLRDRHIPSVFGNTDEWVIRRQRPPDRLGDLAQWTADQLTSQDLTWLANLPFTLTVNPTADPATALQVVHANLRDVNQIIYPAEVQQQSRYGEVRQPDAALSKLLDGLVAHVLAFGHLHIPSIRSWQDHLLLNVSSVNMAGDDDPRAKYALATWNGRRWSAEHIYVEYDVAAEIDAYRETKPPGWQDAVAALETHGTIPQRV